MEGSDKIYVFTCDAMQLATYVLWLDIYSLLYVELKSFAMRLPPPLNLTFNLDFINESKQPDKTFRRESKRRTELLEDLHGKRGCICPVGQCPRTTLHELHFLRAEEGHTRATAYAGDSLICHDAAQQLGTDILHGVECSGIPNDGL